MILKKLYLEQEPNDYITNQATFIAMYAEKVPGLEPCYNLSTIIEVIWETVDVILDKDREQNEGRQTAKGEALQNSFMFFVTQVCRKCKVDFTLALRIIYWQVVFHKKLFKLNKELLT